MTFVTACSSSDNSNMVSDNTPSSVVNTQELEVPSYEISESKSENTPDTSTENPEISSTVTVNYQESEQSTDKEENTLSIEITVNGHTFSVTLYDSETAKEFKARLPLTLDMSELNGNEKYYYLSDSLPTNSSRPPRINSGDIMLYGSSCLVIFYESFSTSYSYTPIGRIDDPAGLAAALGSGSVQVTFNAAPNS